MHSKAASDARLAGFGLNLTNRDDAKRNMYSTANMADATASRQYRGDEVQETLKYGAGAVCWRGRGQRLLQNWLTQSDLSMLQDLQDFELPCVNVASNATAAQEGEGTSQRGSEEHFALFAIHCGSAEKARELAMSISEGDVLAEAGALAVLYAVGSSAAPPCISDGKSSSSSSAAGASTIPRLPCTITTSNAEWRRKAACTVNRLLYLPWTANRSGWYQAKPAWMLLAQAGSSWAKSMSSDAERQKSSDFLSVRYAGMYQSLRERVESNFTTHKFARRRGECGES